jgi:Outer membrane protein transport protein (OMPP1/FadL/TodX)
VTVVLRRIRHALPATTLVVPTFVAALICSPRDARASNVTEVPDNGSEQMGRGGAWVARASDPLATTFNPAGLAGQPSRVTIQSSFIIQHTCFTRIKAANDTSIDLLANDQGRFPRVCNDIEPTLNPQIGGTLRINDRLGIGVLVIGPASAGEKNFPDFVEDAGGTRRAAPQRYLLTRQAGIILFPTVGVGYEVVSNLRIGASFGWGLAKVKNAAATVALNNGGLTSDNDVRANLQVRDYFIPRVSAGVLWSVTPNIDVAGWYQWTDALRAKGDVGTATSYYTAANARGDDSRVGYADTMYSDCGTGRPQDAGKCGSGDNAKVKLAMPMEAKIGLRYHQPRVSLEEAQTMPSAGKTYRRDPLAHDLFDAEIDLTWANNSAIDALEVRFPSDPSGAGRLPVSGINSEIPPNADQPRQYRDVFGVRVGGDYNVIPDTLALRAGAYIETSALREQFQHLDFPASQRIGFALGGTYRIRLAKDPARTDAIEIMAGYGHTFFADMSRTDRNASGIGALAGSPCSGDATPTGPNRCSDGTQRYRTSWPVNLGTITNALNVINVGVAYRF